MASDNDGGGFGWGLLLGGVLGLAAGAYLASGPGREQVEQLRSQTIELTGPNSRLGERARRAVQEGVAAARKRRTELEQEPAAGSPPPTTES